MPRIEPFRYRIGHIGLREWMGLNHVHRLLLRRLLLDRGADPLRFSKSFVCAFVNGKCLPGTDGAEVIDEITSGAVQQDDWKIGTDQDLPDVPDGGRGGRPRNAEGQPRARGTVEGRIRTAKQRRRGRSD